MRRGLRPAERVVSCTKSFAFATLRRHTFVVVRETFFVRVDVTHRRSAVSQARGTQLSPEPGSNCGFGFDFQPLGINDLELVDLTGIEPVTS